MFVRSLEYEFIADQLHYFESQNQHHMFVHAVNKSSVVQQQGFGFSEKAEKPGQKGRGGCILYKKDTGGEGRRAEMKTGRFYPSEKCDVWCVPEWVLAATYVKNITFIHF